MLGRSRRILLVTPEYPPPPGGIQTLTRNLKRGLERTGHEVKLLYVPMDNFVPEFRDLAPRVFALKASPSLLSRVWMYHNYLYRATIREINTFEPDVIHATHINGQGAIEAGTAANIPTVVSTHALELKHEQIASATLQNADRVHAVSKFTKSLVKDLVPDTDVYVVPPSINVEEYTVARDQYDTKPGKVTTMSRFVDRKNISTVIQAWEQIEEVSNNPDLVVIGDGPNRKQLREQASNVASVRFTGWVEREEKLRHLAESELFVLVPRRFGYDVEGFGIVYIESQAAGTPVIGSRHGGVPEAVGEGGMIVEDETDPSSVSDSIQELMNTELNHRYQEQARSRIKAFDLNTVGQKHVREYPS